MTKEEWYTLKASLADAYTDLHDSEDYGKPLNVGGYENLYVLLAQLNMYLNQDGIDDEDIIINPDIDKKKQ